MTLPSFLSPSLAFTLLFAAAVVLGLATKLWLLSRQARYVAQHRDAVPAPFDQRVPLHAHHKAADYTLAKARFGLLDLALGTAVLLGWTLLGGLNALNGLWMDWLGAGMLQQLALLVSFVAINGLLELPSSLYQTFVIEQRFGFNRMTWRLWLTDLIKSTLIGSLISLPLVFAVLWLMGSAGHFWWVWAWALWAGFNLLLMVIFPTWIAPVFNKFEPLADEGLKARVTALMQRCGFAAKGLFVVDGSRRSAHANAYFTGLGAAKRVVFYDTLLKQLTPGEVEAVLAHELGHFKRRHITKRMVGMFAMSLAGLALLGWLSTQVWFYTGLGVLPNVSMDGGASRAPNDALALLLFMLAIPVFSFFISPLWAQMSRKHEFEADAYAMEQANGADLAGALLKLYEDNASTLTPDPLYARFYYSHPPASERLARMPLPPTTATA